MNELLEKALRPGEYEEIPSPVDVEEYAEVISLLRRLNPKIKPAGKSYFQATTTRDGRIHIPLEIYLPGTEFGHQITPGEYDVPNYGTFFRWHREPLRELNDDEVEREVLRILGELALRRPVELKGDEIEYTDVVPDFVLTPYGIGVVSRPAIIGKGKRIVSPHPTDVPAEMEVSKESAFMSMISGTSTGVVESLRQAIYNALLWNKAFLTYLDLKHKAKKSELAQEALHHYMDYLARIIADNAKGIAKKRGQEAAEHHIHSMLSTIFHTINTHVLPTVTEDPLLRRKLKKLKLTPEDFVKEFDRFLAELRERAIKAARE